MDQRCVADRREDRDRPALRVVATVACALLVLGWPAAPIAHASASGVGAPDDLSLAGPSTVRDERSIVLRARLRVAGANDAVVPGAGITVRLLRRPTRSGATEEASAVVKSQETDAEGRVSFEVAPRDDMVYMAAARVRGVQGTPEEPAHWDELTSDKLRVDNLPFVDPVVLPPRAPAPRITLPPQPRAVGEGPNPRLSPVPDRVWNDMVGKSWRRGCVPRANLRYLTVNYLGFDGYRHRGEVVMASAVAAKTSRMFAVLYRNGIRIRALYRPDRFGWTRRVNGADDYKSMAAGNTSMFNCRWVVGRPGVISPHASGRALDLNTWENPYYSQMDGWVPNAWWVGHGESRLYSWKSRSSFVVRLMARLGFRWTYGRSDFQHFDA